MADEKGSTSGKVPANQQQLATELLQRDAARKARIAAKKAASAAKREANAKIREARKAQGVALRTPEEKAADFVRLAKPRTLRAIKAISAIGFLANTSQYAYTDEQVQKIMAALDSAYAALGVRFTKRGSSQTTIDL